MKAERGRLGLFLALAALVAGAGGFFRRLRPGRDEAVPDLTQRTARGNRFREIGAGRTRFYVREDLFESGLLTNLRRSGDAPDGTLSGEHRR